MWQQPILPDVFTPLHLDSYLGPWLRRQLLLLLRWLRLLWWKLLLRLQHLQCHRRGGGSGAASRRSRHRLDGMRSRQRLDGRGKYEIRV